MTEKLSQLNFETAVLLSALPDGRTIAQSITRPEFVAFGSEASVLEQHRRFLERFLLEVRADEVLSFEGPKGLELEMVPVRFARYDVPRMLRREIEIEIPVVLAPSGADMWCLAPALAHTFYINAGDDRTEVIATELARVAAAADPRDLDLRRLLPSEESWLEPVVVELLIGESGLTGRAQALRQREIAERRREHARETLRGCGTFLTKSRTPITLRFRDGQKQTLADRLAATARGSIAIIGDESVGKSALFLDWLSTSSREVVSSSVAQLIAGASGFGEWQERVGKALEAAELLDAVLYFENFGEIFGARTDGGVDIARALHQAVVEERVRVVGELSNERFESARRSHAGLLAAISPIRLDALGAADTTPILIDRIRHWRSTEPQAPTIDEAVAEPIVSLAGRYMPYRSFPGKAVRFLEELRLSLALETDSEGRPRPIGLTSALDAFATTTGIPRFLLRAGEPLLAESLSKSIRKSMIGQDVAVELVTQTICTVKAEMQAGQKPLSTFLFVGPTGVGKTELARTLAATLFGSADRLVRFDMSEFTDASAADRLIRGVGRRDGLLTTRVRETPFCVLLLDEIEKAHPSVHDLLLQVCGSGRLTDGRGRTTFFENAIIVMTSNLGASHGGEPLGIEARPDSRGGHMRAVTDAFRPEMLGRIDRVVPFAALTRDEVAQIAGLAIDKLASRRGLAEAGVRLVVTDGALEKLASDGYSETYGVRALRRHLEQELVTPLAHVLSSLGRDARGVLVWVGGQGEQSDDVANPRHQIWDLTSPSGAIAIAVFRRAAVAGRATIRGLAAISSKRRDGDDLVALSEVTTTAERVRQLTADLAMISTPKKRRGTQKRQAVVSAQISSLQKEHHRIAGAYKRVLSAQHDLHVAEELAITALIGGEVQDELGAEAVAAWRTLRREMFWLLACERRERGNCFLRLARVGTPVVAQIWLSELLEFASNRGHSVQGFDRREPTEGNRSRWSSPIDAAALRGRVDSKPESLNPILIGISGKDAGVLYPVEAGLHRFHGYSKQADPSHLIVELIGLGATLPDYVWQSEVLAQNPPSYIAKSARTDRDRDAGGNAVVVGEAAVEIPEGYFAAIEEIGLEHLLSRRADPGGISAVYSSYAARAEVASETE